jgi:hypothetical protein
MAATEVIHFPLWAQLGLRLLFSDQILFEPASLFPPNLPIQCGFPLFDAEFAWSLSVRNGGNQ